MQGGRADRTWITAYTDASWHEGDRRGGWALWIRTDDTQLCRWGPTPAKARSSLHAEAAAVFAAVHTAAPMFAQAAGMTVKTDCQAVVDAFDGRCSDPLVREWLDRCGTIARAAGVQLRLAWVKGHQPKGKNTGSWLNNVVDDRARKARLTQRSGGWRRTVQRTTPAAP